MREERGPGFDGQRVARKAAVRAVHSHFGEMAVERAQIVAAGGRQQLQKR
jgi:hypothetical protein